ncbi:flagellin [Salinarimonas sp.]|uniref:flagellin N-terminal helical domain-containing protein n=1 Tax=Salinarimonas sp. TaxID=2766526 RepID=UPI00391BBD33
MSQVSLSAGIRDTLLTIQQTTRLATRSEQRLSTGLKVNSAIDNALAFFTAAGLRDRAGDLAGLQDRMQQATRTVKAANDGIEGMRKLFETAQGLANQALAEQNSTTRQALAQQFNEILTQVDTLMRSSGYGGVNLLEGQTLNVSFDPNNTAATLSIRGNNGTSMTATNIGVAAVDTNSWTNAAGTGGDTTGNVAIQQALTQLSTGISNLRAEASRLGANNTVIQTRQEFTERMIATLRSGADDWTLADLNEEGAKLTSLNTRNQIAQTALALAAQRDQSVLRLFS